MKYGIGITTRNRPHVLRTALEHFFTFPVSDARLVIIDDNSDVSNCEAVNPFLSSQAYEDVIYERSDERLGISRAKNACLRALRDCEHVFLFDDDCWPIANNWAEIWADINKVNEIHHSMFIIGMDALLDRNPALRAAVKPEALIGEGKTSMVAYDNCFGVMLYFTREVLDVIGGYDPSTPAPYGHEHAQISQRIGDLGEYTKGRRYWSLWVAIDLIYSVDISYCLLGMEPPISADWLSTFGSSVTPEEMAGAEQNLQILIEPQTFIPLDEHISQDLAP